ncbi:MAG: hypothetical protein HETSPECPRED_010008 [Heterodermia speciosa]|uniref:Uncharacterized protein n=1 Tax=Heterodermia speciosa TaxID=116794 RepID=A0A8H3G5D1_9LECA|nr:MAG: hypothetical protein HETSPECPRED_010008 [Heterodermia speciosa]
MASKISATRILDLGTSSRSDSCDSRSNPKREEQLTGSYAAVPTRTYASVLAGKVPIRLKSERRESTRSYASVVAEATPTSPTSEQKPPTRTYASVVAEAEPKQEPSARQGTFEEGESAHIYPKPEPHQPIGLLERATLQRRKKHTGYYWPSWVHFPVLKELPTPPQLPTQDGATPIPEIIISEPPNSPPTSSTFTPSRRMDGSKLVPRTIRRAKAPRKSCGNKEKGNAPLSEIAPKPSIFSYNICTHPRCPVARPHDKGFFHHGDTDRYYAEMRRSDYNVLQMPFSVSNPLPEIWEAWDRMMGAGDGDARDVAIVEGFNAAHGRGLSLEDLSEEEDSDGEEFEDGGGFGDTDSDEEDEEDEVDFGEDWHDIE